MTPLQLRLKDRNLFAVVIGMTDGILTALTFAAGRLLSGVPPDLSMALRVSAASALSGTFVFFTAEYSRQRSELVHAERQLSLTAHGRLAATHLGRAVLRDTLWAALISILFNFAGALMPLLTAALLPAKPWMAIPVAVLVLGLSGAIVAQVVYGRRIFWAFASAIAGLLLWLAGMGLHVV